MSLTKIDYALSQNFPSGGASAAGPMVSVSGITQADIVAAQVAAGAGGAVHFPPGNYPVAGWATVAANQTFILSPGATLFRTGGMHILTVSHVGTRIYGGTWDGNKLGAPQTGFRAISASQNCGFELYDATIKNIQGYGVGAVDGPFIVKGCKLSEIGYVSIFFQSELLRAVEPIIVEGNIINNAGSDYVDYGGIIIKTNNVAGNYLVTPQIINNRVTLPVPADYTAANTVYRNSVAIELRGASAGIVERNYTLGGVIGVSFAKSNNTKMLNNHSVNAFWYGNEVGDACDHNQVHGNTVTGSNGQSAASCGLSISNLANNTKVSDNDYYGNLQRIRITSDCSGTTEDGVARAGGYNA